jgi:hypothetical protein
MDPTPAPPNPPADDLLPKTPPQIVYRIGGLGAGLCAAAAAVGLIADAAGAGPGPVSTVRLLLVAAGAVLAGSAISLRAGLWQAWAIAAGAGLLSVVGLPDHWDSARLLAKVLTGVAAAGAVLAVLPPVWRYSLASLAVVFHFGGILTATTMPDPAPWISQQLFSRVYSPYLTFAYLRNAYHFYSPEPGPASHLYVLLKFEHDEIDPKTGKPKVSASWVTQPNRRAHMKDPLGLTYYRRLALTEQLAGTIPDLFSPSTFERLDARQRRLHAALGLEGKEPIPVAPSDFEPEYNQYKVPRPDVTRYLLPSYTQHLAVEHSAPGRRVVSMKVYRLEHRIVTAQAFVAKDRPMDPFHPIGYRPYYLGEYDPQGKLIDPDDPLLYWLVPILPKPGGPSPNDPLQIDYDDYLSKHAGYQVAWRRP